MSNCVCTVDRMCDECWDRMVDYLDTIVAGEPAESSDEEDFVEAIVDDASLNMTVSEFRDQLNDAVTDAKQSMQKLAWREAHKSTLRMERARIKVLIMEKFTSEEVIEADQLLTDLLAIVDEVEE